MLSQHMDEGSFLLKPRNKSSVPTDCFSTISYLNKQKHTVRGQLTYSSYVILSCMYFVLLWLWPWVSEVIKMCSLSHFILIPDVFAVLLHIGIAT